MVYGFQKITDPSWAPYNIISIEEITDYNVSHIFSLFFFFLFVCRWASTWCHRVSTLIGLRWELRGKEHLAKDQACIIVANHQSSLDVLGKPIGFSMPINQAVMPTK